MVLGLVLNFIVIKFTYEVLFCITLVGITCPDAKAGWPMTFEIWKTLDYFNLYNIIFWIFVSLIMLSLIRHFKIKH